MIFDENHRNLLQTFTYEIISIFSPYDDKEIDSERDRIGARYLLIPVCRLCAIFDWKNEFFFWREKLCSIWFVTRLRSTFRCPMNRLIRFIVRGACTFEIVFLCEKEILFGFCCHWQIIRTLKSYFCFYPLKSFILFFKDESNKNKHKQIQYIHFKKSLRHPVPIHGPLSQLAEYEFYIKFNVALLSRWVSLNGNTIWLHH